MRVRPREALEAALFSAELEALRALPLAWAAAWLRGLGAARWRFRPAARAEALAEMRALRPEAPPAERAACARTHLVEAMARRRLKYLIFARDAHAHLDDFDVHGWEHVEKALASGRGVVLAGAHLGMPQLVRWYLRTKPAPSLYLTRMVSARSRGPVHRWLEPRLRARHGVDDDDILGEEPFSLQYMKRAHDHLRRGGIAFVAVDGSKGERRIPVRYRGHPQSLGAGAFALALTSGAAILPCFAHFDARPRFAIEVHAPLEPPPGMARDGQIEALARAQAAHIETWARLHPTQVFRRVYLRPEAPPVIERM